MKKLCISFIFILIFTCFETGISINAFASSAFMDYEIKSEVEKDYNIQYYYYAPTTWNGQCTYEKIKSFNDLSKQTTDTKILSKYDESFFENSYLILLQYSTSSLALSPRITSIKEDEQLINIEMVTSKNKEWTGGEVNCGWFILIEMDNNLFNKDITISTVEDVLPWLNVNYYAGCIKQYDADINKKPYIVKIDSVEKLKDYFGQGKDDLVERYNENYFANGDYLLIVNWLEDSSVRTHKILSAYDDKEIIKLELSKCENDLDGYTVPTPYCAVLKITGKITDRDILFVDRSNTSLLNIGENISYSDEYVDIPITLLCNSGFAGAQMEIGFDKSKLTPISISSGEVLEGAELVSNLQSGANLSELENITVIISNDSEFTTDGILFAIKFKIADDFDNGNTPIYFKSVKMINRDLDNIEPILQHGTVTVSNYILGDVNEDKTIDIKDAVVLKQHLYQQTKLSMTQLHAADINQDGIINDSDVDHLEKYLAKWCGIELNSK